MNGRSVNRRNQERRSGVTAVEFAIVAPVFFLILFASIEFSRINVMRSTASNAAYEGARAGLVPGGTAADAITEANNLLAVVGTRSANVVVTPAVLTDADTEITVTVTIPIDQNSFIVHRFFDSDITAQSTLRTERVLTIGS